MLPLAGDVILKPIVGAAAISLLTAGVLELAAAAGAELAAVCDELTALDAACEEEAAGALLTSALEEDEGELELEVLCETFRLRQEENTSTVRMAVTRIRICVLTVFDVMNGSLSE